MSMMLFSFIVSVFMSAMLYMGLAPSVTRPMVRSLSMPISIGRPLLEHFEWIVYSRFWSCSLPCTKGVAKASIAHAALKRSPVEHLISCPVSSREMG